MIVSEDEVNYTNSDADYPKLRKSKVGERFGKLVVIKLAPRQGKYPAYYCRCDCGNYTIRLACNLKPSSLKNCTISSCGCSMSEHKRVPVTQMIDNVKAKVNHEIIEALPLWESKWLMNCPSHGQYRRRYASLITGKYTCPQCTVFGYKEHTDNTLYLLELSVEGDVIAYKYGFTSQNLSKRVYQITKHTVINAKVVYTYVDDGHTVMNIESYIKKTIPSGYLTKGELNSGHTETFHPTYLTSFLQIIKQLNLYKA
jgi:hypothetical protein